MAKTIFKRTERLLGETITEKLQQTRVIVFGVGGVGSWCVECLARTGVEQITIVDSDCVSETNINRQLMATSRNVGQSKVEVMKERLLTINPDIQVEAINNVYTRETADSFHLEEYNYIIDAIDSLEDKAQLILHATQMPGKLFSSMGAALKLNARRIQVDEFWKVHGCPLGKALRTKFKKRKEFPKKKFKCVFSDELIANKGDRGDEQLLFNKVQVNGSLCHITASFGMQLAGLVIEDVCNKE